MSVYFFITPYDPKAWEVAEDKSEKPSSELTIEHDFFGKKLLEHWTSDRCLKTVSGYWILTHLEDQVGGGLEVHLQGNQQVVSFNPGTKNIFLEFILWYRHFVSAEFPLYLFNSSSWESLLLTVKTTERDIEKFTGVIS